MDAAIRFWHRRRLRRLRGINGFIASLMLLQGCAMLASYDTLGRSKGYAWMRRITTDEAAWAGVYFGYAFLVAAAPYIPYIRFRMLVAFTLSIGLGYAGLQFWQANPGGGGWAVYGVGAAWVGGKFIALTVRFFRGARDIPLDRRRRGSEAR